LPTSTPSRDGLGHVFPPRAPWAGVPRDDSALSPVVGTLLIAAVSIAVAVGLSLLVQHLANQAQPQQAELVGFTYDDRAHSATVASAAAFLPWSDLQVTCAGAPAVVPTGNVTAGQTVTCAPGELFRVLHVRANRILATHPFP